MSTPNKSSTCGGGCCSSKSVDKPVFPPTPEPAPVPAGGCSNDDDKDTCCPAPTKPDTNAKRSCTAPCCGEKTPDEISTNIVLPVIDYDTTPSSSCQATICDDKCGHRHKPSPDRRQLVLSIQGMDCPGCSPRVVRALTSFPGVGECHVDVFAGRATVVYCPDLAKPDEMVRHVVAVTGFGCQVEEDRVVGKSMRRMRVQLARPLNGDLPKLDGVRVVGNSGVIEVEYDRELNPRDVLASFEPWGGEYVPLTESTDSAQQEVRRLLYLTSFSAVLTVPVLVLAWAPLPPNPTTYGAISLATTTLIQLVVARPIYTSGLRALIFQHTIDMDLLVSLSIGTAYVFSTVAYACAVANHPIPSESYFETSALLVTLVMLGRLIAAYARRRSTNAVSKLGSIQPSTSTLTNGTTIPTDLVHLGDTLRISPGDIIPTDGRVISGSGYVDESALTGEVTPVKKDAMTGGVLVAGTTLISHAPLEMNVTVTTDANTVSRMRGVLADAQSARLRVQDVTDRVAGWVAPLALVIACVVFVGWVGVRVKSGGSRAVVDAVGYAVAVLVVSCPCALALCVPMVAVIAVAVGSRRGVLFKSVEALENVCKVEVVVFDKTGTLTLGKLGVESSTYHTHPIPFASSEQAIQHLVRDLTEQSTHPVALAIHGHLPPSTSRMIHPSDVRSIPGKGLEVTLQGYTIRGGNAKWTSVPPPSQPSTVFIVSFAPPESTTFSPLAYYTLSDSFRPDALQTVQELTRRGMEVHILSGDAVGVVKRAAEALGIPSERARGGCLPEEKAQWVRFLQSGGGDVECGSSPTHDHTPRRRKVIFIGDGTNDALALTQADTSISLSTGTDIASSAAHIVLLSFLSSGLDTVFTLARAARRRVWINFGWAVVYNLVAVLLASGVLGGVRVPPQWAGLGELVSVLPVVVVAWSLGVVRW